VSPDGSTPTTLTIAQATPADVGEILTLLQLAGLSGNGVAEQADTFLIAREDGRLVAVAGLEDHQSVGLIRSVASHPDHRQRGLATTLVQTLIDRSRALGHRAVYLRTSTAEAYFARFGFRRVEIAQVNPAILASGQFQGEECASTPVMVREFR
jgi:amino-acid N-acetyltransferase